MYLNLFTSTTSSSPTSSLKIGSEKTQNQRIFEYISSFRDLWIQNQDFKKFQASCEKLHEILRISCCGKVPLNLCYPVQLAISKSRTKSGKSVFKKSWFFRDSQLEGFWRVLALFQPAWRKSSSNLPQKRSWTFPNDVVIDKNEFCKTTTRTRSQNFRFWHDLCLLIDLYWASTWSSRVG